MVEAESDSLTDLTGKNGIYLDNNNTNSIGSSESNSSSQEDLQNEAELSKTGDTIVRQVDADSEQYTNCISLGREALEGDTSIIITKQATEDTMSSSPSSYTSSKNISISHGIQGNTISIERRQSPLAHKQCGIKNDEEKNTIKQDYDYNDEINENEQAATVSMSQINNIINLPTEVLIKMVTALLEKIIQSNDNLAGLHQSYEPLKRSPDDTPLDDYYRSCYNAALSFRGKHIPQISLEQYFHRIQKYCPITNDVYLSLLIYFDRISKKCNSLSKPSYYRNDTDSANNGKEGSMTDKMSKTKSNNSQVFVMHSFNIHRLIMTAVTVSTKFSSDFFYSNSRYSKVGGISLKEMNYLEVQFLILCDFNLLISIEEFERYATLLYRFWNSLVGV